MCSFVVKFFWLGFVITICSVPIATSWWSYWVCVTNPALLWTPIFNSCHIFTMTIRSVLWLGCSNIWTWLDLVNHFVAALFCLGLSFFSFRSVAASNRFSNSFVLHASRKHDAATTMLSPCSEPSSALKFFPTFSLTCLLSSLVAVILLVDECSPTNLWGLHWTAAFADCFQQALQEPSA